MYAEKIEALYKVRHLIEELGGQHDQWNILLDESKLTQGDRDMLYASGWRDGEDGWSFSMFT